MMDKTMVASSAEAECRFLAIAYIINHQLSFFFFFFDEYQSDVLL
jgi:hypothetical protein